MWGGSTGFSPGGECLMSSLEERMLSMCKVNLANERRNLKLYKRFLNSAEASPREKEFLKVLVFEKGHKIQNDRKWIKHLTGPRAQTGMAT
jgi:hypothetical protein